jgi:hypothetical protein
VSGAEFKPKKLDRESIEAPLEPQWRAMGPEQERRLLEKSREEYRRFQAFGPRARRRVRVYMLGTAAGFAVIGWFLIDGSLRAIWIFGAVGAGLGLGVALLRPTDFLCGLLYAIAGLVASLLHRGGGRAGMLMALLTAFCFGCIGIACGRAEDYRRTDGDD